MRERHKKTTCLVETKYCVGTWYRDFNLSQQIFQVCKKFNEINKSLLNHGFYTLQASHAKHFKRIKNQLPRRESERRSHACKFLLSFNAQTNIFTLVSKHSDILTSIETRLSMLSMIYQKYIQQGVVCFIPGKVNNFWSFRKTTKFTHLFSTGNWRSV